ncbi:MAG: hypothetical protein E6J43_02310 [Chloroflexi bacterium]|nr:MAG: hypothetical protein E6J43_02310 [Chloroflexota bacterium]
MDLYCPNGCDADYLKYIQYEVSIASFALTTGPRGEPAVDWSYLLGDDFEGPSDDQRFIACASCMTMRRVKLDEYDEEIIDVSPELLPDP